MSGKMVLFGGEKDGLEIPITPTARPDVYYAVPNLDDEKIKRCRGEKAKAELKAKLSILAYRFDPERSSGNRWRMYRAAELDLPKPNLTL